MTLHQSVGLAATDSVLGGREHIFDGQIQGLDFLIHVGHEVSTGIKRSGHRILIGDSSHLIHVDGPAGEDRGYIFGWPRFDRPVGQRGSIAAPTRGQYYDEWACGFSGNFICFLRDESGKGEFYLDATGSLGLVYDAAMRTIASIPDLLPSVATQLGANSDQQRRQELGANAHYGFGATSVPGILRLMPDFALDESDFQARRFWPRQAAERITGGDDIALTREIFQNVRRNVTRVIEGGRGALHLTAGTDTRMVLAAAWEHRHRVPFFTFATRQASNSIDLEVAPVLARSCDLSHFTVMADAPDPNHEDAITQRTGYCVADRGFAIAPISDLVQSHWDFVGGVAGEVGRAYYWRKDDLSRPRPTPAELLERTRIVQRPETLAAADAWLRSLPEMPGHLIWDLAYVEQRLGHWAGAMTYGFRGKRPTTSAFNSFDVVRGKMGLSPEYRLSGSYVRNFIEVGAKTLLRTPINRRAGARGYLDAKTILKSTLPPGVISRIKAIARR